MTVTGVDTLNAKRTLDIEGHAYTYFDLSAAARFGDVSRLPYSLKILLENLLRFEDGRTVTTDDVEALVAWGETRSSTREIAYRPARVLMQDFTGVPAVADLAAMRDAVVELGGRTDRINPLCAVDLVIDHSVMVDEFGTPRAFQDNVVREFERNLERYAFLRWGQNAFDNFRVVPPGTGICHQVNLEYLAQTVWVEKDQAGADVAYPDTLVGTDSHTTMVNGLAVLGWGVGGIEAEAAMLGQPVSMLIPEVVGFRVTGRLPEGATATDLVLTVTQTLRKHGVVNKFVEFFGPGLDALGLGRPRHDRQHGPGIRRHLRVLPDRHGNHPLPELHGARSPAGQAGGGLCPRAGHVARRDDGRSGVQATCWSSTSRRSNRRSPAPAARRIACCCRMRPPRSRAS